MRHHRRFNVDDLSLQYLSYRFPFLFLSKARFVARCIPLRRRYLIQRAFSHLGPFLVGLSIPRRARIRRSAIAMAFLVQVLGAGGHVKRVRYLAFRRFVATGCVRRCVNVLFQDSRVRCHQVDDIGFHVLYVRPRNKLGEQAFIIEERGGHVYFHHRFFSLIVFRHYLRRVQPKEGFPPVRNRFLVEDGHSNYGQFLTRLLMILVFHQVWEMYAFRFRELSIRVLYFGRGIRQPVLTGLFFRLHLRGR